VAFLFAAFCVALIRPRIWRYSGWTGRAVILTLVSLGVCHTVLKIWTAIKLLPDHQSGAKGVNLPLLGKALLNLDQIARILDPDFDPSDRVRRHADEVLRDRMRPSRERLVSAALETREFVEELPRNGTGKVMRSELERL